LSADKPPLRFESFRRQAQELVSSPGRVQSLAVQATRKLSRTSGEKLREVREQITLAIALVKAWVNGDYRQVSTKTIVVLVAALLYFVVPLDVIPDFIFGIGFLDDAAVLGYVFSQLQEEIQAFLVWQSGEQETDEDSA